MSRLIDADKAIEELQEQMKTATNPLYAMLCDKCIEHLENQPIAYDVDKVAEQLKEEREIAYADFTKYVDEYSPCLDDEYDDLFHRGLERAIAVIRKGGANE